MVINNKVDTDFIRLIEKYTPIWISLIIVVMIACRLFLIS